MSSKPKCAICGAVARRVIDAFICDQLECTFAAIARVHGKDEADKLAEAERRGARAMVLYLLSCGAIGREQAEVARKAIDAGWVRFAPG
jgi:hypothetical protein